ncbi:hypothetical protein SDRG_05068 [Saprolegnia diclina VS20]|uniref:Uncharacterized protein n=1 Tax=Saprolegnia diclina (strain VS20) TaxID=1156394 RepID=T0QU12_SAPDV|nr:hypothetical protein SDRG_05068 [Saprolegnia diclina VS20]EQC37465.1 hypothetical protein SDRG_05068 [Saprolegnia diclina VS20]|eukprot:XP_008608985.1 hypothetical protein SDRG_05068 [Saprolegnia diclina VS20]
MKTPSTTTRSAARERQLLADRLSKRKARLAYVAERNLLQSAIEALTLRYFAIKGTLLPWRDIALALRETSEGSLLENHALHIEVTKADVLVQRLRRWFQTMETPERLPGYLSRGASLDVTLVAEASTRQLGYDWVAKQLYHGTSAQLSPRLFPCVYEDSIKVEWGVRGRKLVVQKVIQASQEVVAKALWAANCASATEAFPIPGIQCGGMQVLHDEVTSSERCSYVLETSGEIHDHCLKVFHKRFKDDDRIIIAYRTISLDEAHPGPRDPEEYQEWNEIRRISANSCLVRTVNHLEPRQAFASVLDYVETLYPKLYHRCVAEYATQLADASSLEQYMNRFLLQRAAWIATDHFEHLDRTVDSVLAQPDCFHY